MAAKNGMPATRAATSGHNPASDLALASSRKKNPIATPDASACHMPDGNPDRDGRGTGWSGCALSCPSSTMATTARAMPCVTSTGNCSPRRKPASTGMTTAQTEVVGATTPIVPIASARYSSPTPKPPARPLAAPHAKSD